MRGTRHHVGHGQHERRSIPAHAGNTFHVLARAAGRPVHPRACGEHGRSGRVRPAFGGPSPRMRGTLGVVGQVLDVGRSIPAHAGNTQTGEAWLDDSAVHPRACGEHRYPPPVSIAVSGPSPRMRGTRSVVRFFRRMGGPSPRMRGTRGSARISVTPGRSIPAHAGNTWTRRAFSCPAAVHPRACGEHPPAAAVPPAAHGPSPRMRGTRNRGAPSMVSIRSIPAHAGNTLTKTNMLSRQTVHPRACGEHRIFWCRRMVARGPSPRMRGTPRRSSATAHSGRSIPAHAGNTTRFLLAVWGFPVHPRACGEHNKKECLWTSMSGPSPRMRGTPPTTKLVEGQLRSIPAHAGNTRISMFRSFHCAVHPRACGEHALRLPPRGVVAGPSPRMRGTRIPAG